MKDDILEMCLLQAGDEEGLRSQEGLSLEKRLAVVLIEPLEAT
jgi:hypothetical protein